jgi:hypothetical protein
MLVIVAAVERKVGRDEFRFETPATLSWKLAGQSVGRAAGCDVVALGDSLVFMGVVPSVLERGLGGGRSAYNLAVPRGTPVSSYLLLRRLIRSGSRPRAVLVDGDALESGLSQNLLPMARLATLAESAGVAASARDPAVFARLAAAGAVPTLRARDEVRASVLAALKGSIPLGASVVGPAWRNCSVNRGAYVMPDWVDPPGGDRRHAEVTAAPSGPWVCDPVNALYAERLLGLAGAHGIRVFWLLPPYFPGLIEARAGWRAGYDAMLRGLLARHPNLTVLDARHAGYPREAVTDLTHLDRTGAVVFTRSVAAELRRKLDGGEGAGDADPRWVELPRYDANGAEDLASAAGVEDFVESGKAFGRNLRGAEGMARSRVEVEGDARRVR